MEAVFILVPLAAVLALGTVAALFWAVRSGQFEDLEGPAHRILMEEDPPLSPPPRRIHDGIPAGIPPAIPPETPPEIPPETPPVKPPGIPPET